MLSQVVLGMLDITADPTVHVEVQLREDKKVLWVNVDGICRLRICRINPENLTIDMQMDNILGKD